MILIVRHGKYKARLYPYLHPLLQYIKASRSKLYKRLLFHETGTSFPQLEGISTIVFWLADPLREMYPSCYEEAKSILHAARSRNLCIINSPEALSNTVKSTQSRLWMKAGIPTPVVKSFSTYQEMLTLTEEFHYPLLVRSDERHAQEGIIVCENRADVESIPEKKLIFPGAISHLVDVRKDFRLKYPRSIWARFFHKKRLLILGNIIRTKHIFFSTDPIVSTQTCKFRFFRNRLGLPNLGWMTHLDPWAEECIREDVAYWQKFNEHDEIMLRAINALKLNFAAIDYSSLTDGSVILWEANPYFYLPQEKDIMLPNRRKARERVESYYRAIADFLEGLPGG